MKSLSWTFIIPLTVISFTIFTKWWYVLPIDAPDTMMAGFPFPYVCDGWHTSLSLQIFIFELCIDVLIHFVFWLLVIFCVDRYILKINIHKIVTIILMSIAGLFICGHMIFAFNPDNRVYIKRPFDMDILKTGYRFFWEGNKRPVNFDFNEYRRGENK